MNEQERIRAVVLENVEHIARGCRSGRSHNPAVYVQAIRDALEPPMRGLVAAHATTARANGRVFNERMQAEDRARRLADLGIELVDPEDAAVGVELVEPQAAAAATVDTAVSDAVSSGAGAGQPSLTGRRDSPQGSTSEPAPSPVDAPTRSIPETWYSEERVRPLVEALRQLLDEPEWDDSGWARHVATAALAEWERS